MKERMRDCYPGLPSETHGAHDLHLIVHRITFHSPQSPVAQARRARMSP